MLVSNNVYQAQIKQIELINACGILGVKTEGEEIKCRSAIEIFRACFSLLLGNGKEELNRVRTLIALKTTSLNGIHKNLSENSPCLDTYFKSARVIDIWNKQFGLPTSFWGRVQECLLLRNGCRWKTWGQALSIEYSREIGAHVPELPGHLFKTSYLNSEKLPLVVSPADPKMTLQAFLDWAKAHQAQLKRLMFQHGALLLRGFPILHANDFAATLEAVTGRTGASYKSGEGSRDLVRQGVYTSTKAPDWFHIPLHNELACTDKPLEFISFYCSVPPKTGTGQTLLGDSKRVAEAIKKEIPQLWNALEGKTIKHISRHPPEGSFFRRVNQTHRTWQESFETKDKKEVEAKCREKGFAFRWIGEWLEITRRSPALKGHSENPHELLWMNQSHLYHSNAKLRGGWLMNTLANLLYCHPDTRAYDILMDDGSPIPNSILQLYDLLEKHEIRVDWQKNDVMILDNFNAMHGKAPSTGARRIYVSMIPHEFCNGASSKVPVNEAFGNLTVFPSADVNERLRAQM